MYKYIHLVLLLVCVIVMYPFQITVAQNTASDSPLKNGISKPNTLATHPFGILFYTLPHNFKSRPDNAPLLDIHLSSGNIWGQAVDVFIPSLSPDQARMEALPFYSRGFGFNPSESPSEYYSFQYDGVIKDFRLALAIPLNERNELKVSTRSFLLTTGKFPFSTITGDQFIEFFHSNVAGGEDPFGRRALGMDHAQIQYIDRKGNSFELTEGSFVFSGIETAFYTYSNLFAKHHIILNFGAHAGLNLSSINTSLDLGASVGGTKNFSPKRKGQFLVGMGLNILRKRAVGFNRNQVDLGTSSIFGSFEGHLEYSKQTPKGARHSFGLNYRIQTPYNNKKEEDHYVPSSPDRIARWHEAARHLYKFPSYWSLIYSFTKKKEISLYLQQDMLVNNAPDIQLGANLKIPFSF
ncbi:hypothetical protein [Flagellimonas algicola]|uniref:DUF3187 family protein n=1 Tax=Flagellimonas algicola TaxID=2583815 RepID=A0ABY2WJR3_9FLAO|nr:hypothetical protein [Allomuricauda algicola]TMU55078.1 hypothetical protein FGG15_12895 [Allomuricauda algicola]